MTMLEDRPRSEGREPSIAVGVAPDPFRLRRRRRWVAVLLAPVVLIVAVVVVPAVGGAADGVAGWLDDRRSSAEPRAFDDDAGWAIGVEAGVAPGTEVHLDLVTDLPAVDVVAAEPRLGSRSGPAAVAVSLCRARPAPAAVIGSGGSVMSDEVELLCAELLPADGADLGSVDERDSLVLTVVPLTTRAVHVDGVDLTYEQGGRRATQQVGPTVDLGPCADPEGGLPGPVC